MLCRWEGTLWARQRYERDEGIRVLDTTGTEIQPWVDRRPLPRRKAGRSPASHIKVKTDIEIEIEEMRNTPTPAPQSQQEDTAMQDATAQIEDSDEELESVGIELNQRLIAAAAAREHIGLPNSDIPMDPAWEAYLKEAAERGGIPFMGDVSSSLRAAALARLSALNATSTTQAVTSGAAQPTTAQPEQQQH
jgi:hypothetical protein